MPIEIREMMIEIVVAGEDTTEGSGQEKKDKELVDECLEQMFSALDTKKER